MGRGEGKGEKLGVVKGKLRVIMGGTNMKQLRRMGGDRPRQWIRIRKATEDTEITENFDRIKKISLKRPRVLKHGLPD
ncbi:MAG: hypothetical protein AMJ79_15955 [Phycisphaerae bacterium SM23_30]|nr:MAG: hypothetical protein AMJ79_15955 [Phycisphaerae bacterium SM23_30]